MSDASHRCADCAYFHSIRIEPVKRIEVGDCSYGTWPPVRPVGSSCGAWVAAGTLRRHTAAPPKRTRARETHVEAPARRAPIDIEVDDMDEATFRTVLREILRDELALGETPIAEKFRGGEVILKPGKEGLKEQRIPIDALLHKVVMVRDRLRVLEQKINQHPRLADDEKVSLQQYITGCYGSLTTFNVLFKDEEDRFVGAASKE
ncbi:MAG: hypothetical protein R3A48_17580 [Polyangiales bacterium]